MAAVEFLHTILQYFCTMYPYLYETNGDLRSSNGNAVEYSRQGYLGGSVNDVIFYISLHSLVVVRRSK